ncbi:MAG: type I secretion C-terminal target domain-containing protein, partial [Citrobacter sp.]
NIGKYISVETNADGKAVISIDRDGASNGLSDLLVLDNISPADLNLTNDQLLNNLLNNNQIVY